MSMVTYQGARRPGVNITRTDGGPDIYAPYNVPVTVPTGMLASLLSSADFVAADAEALNYVPPPNASYKRLSVRNDGALVSGADGVYTPVATPGLALLEILGHSGNDGTGLARPLDCRWTRLVADYFGCEDERNLAIGGAVASWCQSARNGWQSTGDGGYAFALQQLYRSQSMYPYVAESQAVVIHHGLNDESYRSAGNNFMEGIKEAHRIIIARARAAAVFENDDPSVAYGAGWTLRTAIADGKFVGSGDSRHYSDGTVGRQFTITVPHSVDNPFPGGEIDLGFNVGVTSDYTVSITVDGGAATVRRFLGTELVDQSGSRSNQFNGGLVRLTGITPGAHTIVVTVTAGAASFDYWQITAPIKPIVLVALPYQLYGDFYNGRPGYPVTDADVVALKNALLNVVAEFDERVLPVDFGEALGTYSAKTRSDWLADKAHPSEQGHYKLAQAVIDVLEPALRRFPDVLVKTNPYLGRPGRLVWQFPTLLNGWVPFGAALPTPRFRRMKSGLVVVQGGLKDGGAFTQSMWQMPKECYTDRTLYWRGRGVTSETSAPIFALSPDGFVFGAIANGATVGNGVDLHSFIYPAAADV